MRLIQHAIVLAIILALLCGASAISALSAHAQRSGGLSPGGPSAAGATQTTPGAKAKLARGGKAIAPARAPKRVKDAIAAANRIEDKPYKWGGGHGSWNDSGYDCSGAVSYVLHKAGVLDAPLASGGLAKYGKRGKGEWITVYGASSHAYIVVAGLRFDTANTRGDGPSWSRSLRSTPESYKARHPKGL